MTLQLPENKVDGLLNKKILLKLKTQEQYFLRKQSWEDREN